MSEPARRVPRGFTDLVLSDERLRAAYGTFEALEAQYSDLRAEIVADLAEAEAAGDLIRTCELRDFLRRYP